MPDRSSNEGQTDMNRGSEDTFSYSKTQRKTNVVGKPSKTPNKERPTKTMKPRQTFVSE